MDKDHCQGCSQQNTCREVYQKLGKWRGPSVFRRSIVVFLMPILVFIFGLAASERLLAGVIKSEKIRLLAGIGGALAAGFIWVLVSSRVMRWLAGKKNNCGNRQ